MNYIILLTLFAGIYSLTSAQTYNCSSSHPLFAFPLGNNPVEVHELGASPQFDFLKGIGSTSEFFTALQKNRNTTKYKKDYEELARLLNEIGFSNGLDDSAFTEQSLNYEFIKYGTIGNLGTNAGNYIYSILLPKDVKGVPGWKLSSPSGCYIYIFTKCGNAFYPQVVNKRDTCCNSVTVKTLEKVDTLRISTSKTKRLIKIELYAYYLMSGKGKGSSTRMRSGLRYIGQTSVEFESSGESSITFNVRIPSVAISKKICLDQIIEIPITQELTSALQANQHTESETDVKKNLEVTKRIYRQFKRMPTTN